MKILLRSCCLVSALFWGAGTAGAQWMQVSPLPADPARAALAVPASALNAQQRGTTTVSLPFFDDFTSPLEGRPRVDRWLPGGGAFVSNRLALQPLTRGAATLDGLKANGQSYSNSIQDIFTEIDTLTSQPIDLAGKQAVDSVYLSFAWQAGSIIGAPQPNGGSTPVSLELFFKTNAGRWQSVWSTLSTGRRTGFRQQVFVLNQAQYLHGSFQFRFQATGNSSLASDTWSIDYVLLEQDRGRGRRRVLNDTTFADIATSAGLRGFNPSGGLRSPLRRYTAMPAWQFRASELNTRLGVNISNLNAGQVPISWRGTVRDLATPNVLGWLSNSRPVNSRLDSVQGNANRAALGTSAMPRRLRYTLTLDTREQTLRTLPNDTIYRDVDLNNYFAYDDGTAEAITNLADNTSGPPSYRAYRFTLNQDDYVGGLRLYPAFTASDRNARPITINVWDDDNGRPAAQPRATKSAVIPYLLPSGATYYEVTFDQPVRVTGTFYVGFGQPAQGRTLHYGFDLNSYYPAGHFWGRNAAGVWDSIRTTPRGVLMMRPVMTNNVSTATRAARESASFALYPNPAHGTVRVVGSAFSRATVLDALGRVVWEQPAGQAGQPTLPLPGLPAGVYLVRLVLPDGSMATRRLLLE